MNESLVTLNERLSSFEGETREALIKLDGKIRGNHDLISKEFQAYMEKDACVTHRTSQGERVSSIEQRVTVLETVCHTMQENLTNIEQTVVEKKHVVDERVTAWLPDIVKVIIIVGGIIFALAKGWLG